MTDMPSYQPHPFDVMKFLAKRFCGACAGNKMETNTDESCRGCPVEQAMKGER